MKEKKIKQTKTLKHLENQDLLSWKRVFWRTIKEVPNWTSSKKNAIVICSSAKM